MITTIGKEGEDYDKYSTKPQLPMYSRTGKSTSSQYQAFQTSKDEHITSVVAALIHPNGKGGGNSTLNQIAEEDEGEAAGFN